MSCLCCWSRRNLENSRQDENESQPGHYELDSKLSPKEMETPRASSMRDDNSIGSRSSLHERPEVQIIINSFHDVDAASSPSPVAATPTKKLLGSEAVMKDCGDNQPVVDGGRQSEPNKSKTSHLGVQAATNKSKGTQKCNKSADDCDEEQSSSVADISISSETGSTHYFENVKLYSRDSNDLTDLKNEFLKGDSFDEEFNENAVGRPMHMSDYVMYDNNESASQANDQTLISLCKQRDELLNSISQIVPKLLLRINRERERHCSNKINILHELNEFATALWLARARIQDGFVVVPRGVFFPRSGEPNKRCGCLVYATRAVYPLNIPDMMVNFWINNGGENDDYAREDSKMGRAFQKYKKNFRSQLLAAQCKAMGVHIDMVRTAENRQNLICVAVVFDYVANSKGRNMPSPFI